MARSWILIVSVLVGTAVVSAQAAPMANVDVVLGDSGWKLNGPSFYDLNVNVNAVDVTNGVKWVSISISKNFRYGPSPLTGQYPSITLDFSQVEGVADEDLATRFIIENEVINNSTGTDWTDFHWTLFRHGIAEFNQDLTNPTTDENEFGWLISPFTESEWEYEPALDVETLSVAGGVVVDGDSFYAGSGSGAMVIDIDLGSDPDRPSPAIFKLAQNPTPEPGSVSLLALGAAAVLRKRRRA